MFKSFLLEGQNEDKAKSLLKKNDKYSDEIFEKYDFAKDKKDAYFHVNDVWEKILYSLEKTKEIVNVLNKYSKK